MAIPAYNRARLLFRMKGKILMISRFFRPYVNGDAIVAEELSKRLAGSYSVTILTTLGAAGGPRRERGEGVEIYRVGVGNAWWDKHFFSFFVFIKSFFVEFDFVFGAGGYAGLAGAFIKLARNKPYVLREGNGLIGEKFRAYVIWRPIIRWIYLGADLVIAVSNFMENELKRIGVSPKKIIIIPNGIDSRLFRPLAVQKVPYRIITVARLEKIKGIDYLLRALPIVVDYFPRAHLLVAGGGDQRRNLEKLANDLGVGERVSFKGVVDNDQLPLLLNSAVIFAGSSVCDEGFGIVIAEALACGLAVVGTKSGGVVDIVSDGVSGLLVDKRDSQALAIAIIKLFRDDDLRAKTIAGGLSRARELNWGAIAAKYQEVFDGLTTTP